MRRGLSAGVAVGVVALLAAMPAFSVTIPKLFTGPLDSPGTLQLLALCCVYAGVALTYDLLFGYTGLLSFGHALYFATGVYIFSIALTKWSFGFAPSIVLTLLVGVVLPLVIGAVSLRVGGVAFAMVTYSVAQLGAILVTRNPGGLTGGETGFALDFMELPSRFLGVFNTKYLYWLALAYVVVVYVVVRWAVESSPGRIWQGIRDNEVRMEVLSIRSHSYKLMAFVLASFLCTAGGIVYVLLGTGPDPATTSAHFTLSLLIMVVLGGAGTKWGAVIGAVLYTYLDNRLSAIGETETVLGLPGYLRIPISEPEVILGTLFILVVLFVPGGLSGIPRLLRRDRESVAVAVPAAGEES